MTMDDKLFLAPLSNPQNVMDIATGTGIWAIEFGNTAYSLFQLDQLG
jgi:ubiquinone/menaquinone biosynthesis C-methylase UbiE